MSVCVCVGYKPAWWEGNKSKMGQFEMCWSNADALQSLKLSRRYEELCDPNKKNNSLF